MSSIAGIYQLAQTPVDRALLRRMIDCVPHRGADAMRTWVDGFVGLGHGQLYTTEEATREIQPAVNAARTCRVTFDGRLDNREELIDRLRPSVGKLKNPTDVELLLHAYDVWGIECARWIIGDFSFALWDIKEQKLFCARDTYGIRPFYYHFNGKTFTFGSECVQLFQDPKILVEIDGEKIAEWFTVCGIHSRAYGDITRSFFRGISELPFAHYLVVDRTGIKLRRYWDVNPKNEIRYRRDAEYIDHFNHVFREAVRCRLRSRGPVGAELSGGFDSSSIVCVAQDILKSTGLTGPGFATFSLVFNELSCDERPLISAVVEKYSLESHYLPADDLCGLQNFPPGTDSFLQIDNPDQFHTQKAMSVLYQRAYDRGVRVMLSGEGAENHVLGSSLVFDSLVKSFQWTEVLRRLQTMTSRRDRLGEFVRFGLIPLLPKPMSLMFYLRWIHPELNQPFLPPWLTSSFRDNIMSRVGAQLNALSQFPRFPGWGRQVEYDGLNPSHSMLGNPFPLAMERRFPYHDRRLVELCLALPPEQKYQHLASTRKQNVRRRSLQRRALAGILPESIRQSQSKVNFNDVYRRRFSRFKDAYVAMFAPPIVPLVSSFGYVDKGQFWAVLSESLKRAESGETSAYLNPWIGRVTSLEIWLRTLESVRHRNKFAPVEACVV
jgi:asparagine synthase (glutamine-hydrolysing)